MPFWMQGVMKWDLLFCCTCIHTFLQLNSDAAFDCNVYRTYCCMDLKGRIGLPGLSEAFSCCPATFKINLSCFHVKVSIQLHGNMHVCTCLYIQCGDRSLVGGLLCVACAGRVFMVLHGKRYGMCLQIWLHKELTYTRAKNKETWGGWMKKSCKFCKILLHRPLSQS